MGLFVVMTLGSCASLTTLAVSLQHYTLSTCPTRIITHRKHAPIQLLITSWYIVGCSENTHWDYERIITDLYEDVRDGRITTRVALRAALTDRVNQR